MVLHIAGIGLIFHTCKQTDTLQVFVLSYCKADIYLLTGLKVASVHFRHPLPGLGDPDLICTSSRVCFVEMAESLKTIILCVVFSNGNADVKLQSLVPYTSFCFST